MIRVAIFADIHGKILLPFKLVNYYQQITGNKIDWILQCGDIGAFPDKSRLDKATLRHAKSAPEELGFLHDFTVYKPYIADFLKHLNIQMLCVRGNHEDHDFLDKLEIQAIAQQQSTFSIDVYQKVLVCRSGIPITLQKLDEQLSILPVGRIGDRKARTHSTFIQPYERQAIETFAQTHSECDILLSHDKDSESQRGYGSIELYHLLNQVEFSYHFYGHTGEPFSQTLSFNGITQSVKVKELEFNAQGKLEEGCMIILEKTQNQGIEKIQISAIPLYKIIHFDQQNWQNY
ncbi:metallophosphoesterase [Suttonella ornithocola]|uniref:Calcineurin-like phosphoesterase superfamily domain n=1 Tax=Suttonella ornithocola TaxID=279832 RepID=A0A380MSX4_9GAMM|nr:metallophosphoesterase [Suttonella ornithocola]SUO94811.1 Calcineurin-like phosphoesterase superfamily domain [Suttonella ornithocola]